MQQASKDTDYTGVFVIRTGNTASHTGRGNRGQKIYIGYKKVSFQNDFSGDIIIIEGVRK